MKRRIIWIGAALLGALVIVVAALAIFVRISLQGDRLKAFIIPKAEQLTGRKVSIDSLDVSLFRGIVAKGLNVRAQDGVADFFKTDEFILDYSLLPLLKKQIVITRIEFRSPSLSVERLADGRYSYEDITHRKGETAPPSGEPGFPFSLATDKIIITNAKINFRDAQKDLPDLAARIDAGLSLSAGKELSAMAVTGNVTVKELKATKGSVQVDSTGKIDITQDRINVSAKTTVGKDTVETAASVEQYRTKPVARCDLHAKELDLERLMALAGGPGRAPTRRVQTKGEKETATTWTASGKIAVDTARFKGYLIKDLLIPYQVKDGLARFDPITMKLAGGDQVNAAGDLHAALSASVAGPEGSLKKSVAGKGNLDLTRAEVKHSAIWQAISVFTGIRDLASPRFDNGHFSFTIQNEKVNLEGTMNSAQVKINPAGTVGFDTRMDVTADLSLSPQLSSLLPSTQFSGILKDEQGWSVLPLRITGTTDKPSVGLNQAAVQKKAQQTIEREIGNKLLKGIFGR